MGEIEKSSLRQGYGRQAKSQKSIIRASIYNAIRMYNNDEKDSELICSKLLKMQIWKDAKNIMIYSPIKGEVDISKILKDKNKKFYYPKAYGQDLKIFYVKQKEDLEKGSYGVLEPKDSCEEIDGEILDLVIVPGLAFTREGKRLGRGKGFYDRFLEKLKERNNHFVSLSLAFNFQMLSDLSTEEHDEKIDIVICL